MSNRRKFIKQAVSGSISLGLLGVDLKAVAVDQLGKLSSANLPEPVVISTWNHGLEANEAAWQILSENGSARI